MHRHEAEEAQRKLLETQASLEISLSTSDAIKFEVEKEFARLSDDSLKHEHNASHLERETQVMRVTIATLTAEQSHLKAQLDTVLAEARRAATAAADMGQAVAALSTHAGAGTRRATGAESASRARRGASPEERGDRLSLSLSALSVSEDPTGVCGSAQAAVEDLGEQVRRIARERDTLHGELATARAGKATVESALVQMSHRVKELEAETSHPRGGATEGLPTEGSQLASLKSAVAQLRESDDALQGEVEALRHAQSVAVEGEAFARGECSKLDEKLRRVKAQCECLRLEIAQLEHDRSDASALAKEATDTAAKAFEAQHQAEQEAGRLRQQLATQAQPRQAKPHRLPDLPSPPAAATVIQPYEPRWMSRVGGAEASSPAREASQASTTVVPAAAAAGADSEASSSFGTGFFMKSRFARTEELDHRIAQELAKEEQWGKHPPNAVGLPERTAGEAMVAASPTLKDIMGLQKSWGRAGHAVGSGALQLGGAGGMQKVPGALAA